MNHGPFAHFPGQRGTMTGMKQRGVFLSTNDELVLAILRHKGRP
jgi:hypothetical protein